MDSTTPLEALIQAEANRCVKCGLCLPSCPTYVITKNEAESPRGRIALMEGLAKRQLPLTAKLEQHIDNCLTCRACEAVCPSEVAYGQLFDHSRELMTPQTKLNYLNSWLQRSIEYSVRHPWLMRIMTRLLRFAQQSGLFITLRKLAFLQKTSFGRALNFVPALPKKPHWKRFYPAIAIEQGNVALFLGCMSPGAEPETIAATIKLLTHCGYNVYVPDSQNCCGAIHLHSGKTAIAKKLAQQNIAAFNVLNVSHIINVASGCGATLSEYFKYSDDSALASFANKIIDINVFLNQITWPSRVLNLKALLKTVAIHIPCTMRNVLKQTNAVAQVLAKIPGINLVTLNNQSLCCGAAGTYMLHHPVMADTLGEKTLDNIVNLHPDYLVTSNIGCRLQLQKILRDKGLTIAVLHPVTLLARQL